MVVNLTTPVLTRRPMQFSGRRSMAGLGRLGLTCSPPLVPTPQYDGTTKCCGPGDGSVPCQEDPCCVLNSPGFIAQQNTEVQQDIASSGPIDQPTLELLASLPINIGQAAVCCQTNPGGVCGSNNGQIINCPSGSHSDVTTGGQPMSTYSIAQLAQMLMAQYGGAASTLPGNAPSIAPTPNVLNMVAPGPTQLQMPTAAPNNALANSAGQTAAPTTPSAAQISNGQTQSGNLNTAVGPNAVPVGTATDDAVTWLESNWMLVAAGVAALMILPGLIGGRH